MLTRKTRSLYRKVLYTLLALIFGMHMYAIEIESFEHLNSRDGLSMNSVLSAYCDKYGFMWFGTMNGLNRYDGYNFKVYKAIPGEKFVLTNNRITDIWEDDGGFLWLRSHDGYYHYLDRKTEKFYTFPLHLRSEEERNSVISCFSQVAKDEIWLGTTRSGVYRLKIDTLSGIYKVSQFVSRGNSSITNNNVHFIMPDDQGNIWIGTERGLNYISAEERLREYPAIQHTNIQVSFRAATQWSNHIWFGTSSSGIISYHTGTQTFSNIRVPGAARELEITHLSNAMNGQVIVGTGNDGLYIYYPRFRDFQHFSLNGQRVNRVFRDRQGRLWVDTENFGINSVDPEDPKTINSNFVHCITEDRSGLLWVGTGQFNGGLNKVIPANPLFEQIILKEKFTDISENVVRSLMQDNRENIWAATKSGNIYVTDARGEPIAGFPSIPFADESVPGFNVYCMIMDDKGYIWMGSKGGGVAVSTKSMLEENIDYDDIKFHSYRYEQDDSASLSSDMIYSICQDHRGSIWIGTYEHGLSRVIDRTPQRLTCERINTTNSNLSGDEVRYIYEDSQNRLWIATTFGLNMARNTSPAGIPSFSSFHYDPLATNSLSYNDVIHIYEDSRQQLWFGTFGGGVNRLSESGDQIEFEQINEQTGLVNDAVFGILEDSEGYLWFSTEQGISKYNPVTGELDNFNNHNGLISSNFSENTCLLSRKGNLLFGSTHGIIMVNPVVKTELDYSPNVVLTNFQLFNKDVVPGQPGSPLKSTIETTDRLVLRHDQNSFSFEYAALSFFDPEKNQYAFMLENFDPGWIQINNQRKATYTNLSPGEYIFRVRASDLNGQLSNEITSISVLIHPPWWRTAVAYIGYILIFLILGELTRRIITRYARLRNDLRVERRVNELKLQFFTNISHEIRTPLTLVLGPLDDIRNRKDLPAGIASSFEIMYRNGQRMLRLINQLLDFRKIQNRKMKLKVREIDLEDFLGRILANFDYLSNQKKIIYQRSFNLERKMVWIDPDKIDSVLFNILSNAFKFTPAGKKISVSVTESDAGFDIRVADQGKGIPEDKIPLLFNRYTSLSTDIDYFAGTGIGLSFSMELVKLHSGDIFVESTPGEGSVFTVRILKGKNHFQQSDIISDETQPLPGSPEHQQESTTEPWKAQSGYNPNRPVVLIVEDNHDIIDYIARTLRKDYQVESAVNGKEALDKIGDMNPDLVITDVMMPVMDGMELTRCLKNEFATSHIPVVMLTAKSNMHDQIQGIDSGAEAYILKPFNSEYLRAVIANLLKQREVIIGKFAGNINLRDEKLNISNKDHQFLEKVISIIRENYADPDFNVERLAGQSGISRTVFYNKIKGLTGKVPVDLLKEMRLRYAALLLEESDRNVSEIAYMTGFNDERYFSKCFKSVYHLTPSSYRKDHQAPTRKKPIDLTGLER